MRIRKPSDDDLPVSEILIGTAFVVLILALAAWGLGIV
jgi:hypothetical protein